MTEQYIVDILEQAFPNSVCHMYTDEEFAPPYVCYYSTGSGDVMADNSNFFPVSEYNIELYASGEQRNAAVGTLESAFRSGGLPYSRGTDNYIKSERLILVPFFIKIIGG